MQPVRTQNEVYKGLGFRIGTKVNVQVNVEVRGL